MRVIDLHHLGRDRVIGTSDLDGVLVDPGPTSCLPTLLDALGGQKPRALLLTHIHFDHAGAAGALVRRWPDLEVHVHSRGARHLAAPDRLVSSAIRLYGEEDFRRLWGEVVPVPEANLRVLEGGETVLGDFRVAYAPGHAVHHVVYLHEPSGTALVGDVAGVRIPPAELVVAPTPPPDIDVEAWDASLDLLEDWDPDALGLTHFGRVDDVRPHLGRMREMLHAEAEMVARLGSEEEFEAEMRARLQAAADAATAASYIQAASPHHLWLGLERYHAKRAETV